MLFVCFCYQLSSLWFAVSFVFCLPFSCLFFVLFRSFSSQQARCSSSDFPKRPKSLRASLHASSIPGLARSGGLLWLSMRKCIVKNQLPSEVFVCSFARFFLARSVWLPSLCSARKDSNTKLQLKSQPTDQPVNEPMHAWPPNTLCSVCTLHALDTTGILFHSVSRGQWGSLPAVGRQSRKINVKKRSEVTPSD